MCSYEPVGEIEPWASVGASEKQMMGNIWIFSLRSKLPSYGAACRKSNEHMNDWVPTTQPLKLSSVCGESCGKLHFSFTTLANMYPVFSDISTELRSKSLVKVMLSFANVGKRDTLLVRN